MARRNHLCDVPGCNAPRKRWQRLCDRCWCALPRDIRTGILEAHRQHRRADHRTECKRAAEHLAHRAARHAPPPETAPWMMRD